VATRLYGLLWRWHFLAGIAAVPILFVLAVTGAIYAFQPEIEAITHGRLRQVEPSGERLPLERLLATPTPGCKIEGFNVPGGPGRTIELDCAGPGRRAVFLDPYRGVVVGERTWDTTFLGWVFRIHWDLLLGDTGRYAIEWATSWTLLLAFSGLALWWPRGRRRTGGVVWPRLRLSGRPLLRDLHAVLGAYVVPLVCAIAMTGLFWTLWAGEARWKRLARDDDAAAREAAPPRSRPAPAGTPRIGLDAAVAAIGPAASDPRIDLYVVPPAAADAPYTIYPWDPTHEHPSWSEEVWVDAYAGDVLRRAGWDQRNALGKLDASGYSVHVGALLGLPGRILAATAGLVLAFSCVTGPWMWWKRRKHGRRLAPPPPAGRAPVWLLLVLAGLGVVLPMVGATLLFLLAAAAVRRAAISLSTKRKEPT
jgi:uncharacterized iron-regulated membrane protein